MGDTLEPSIDPGHYILTWQNPDSDHEMIFGFANDLETTICWLIEARHLNETIAQNRILRIREQYSFWKGPDMMLGSSKILSRTLDGKIILQMNSRNKPVCPKCKVNVLDYDEVCTKCRAIELQLIANCKSKMCNSGKHENCKGIGKLSITNEPCICDCHKMPKPFSVAEEMKKWFK